MVRNHDCTGLLRLMVDCTRNMVDRGLASSVGTVDPLCRYATGRSDQGRGDEEFGRREGRGLGEAGLDKEWVRCLVEVKWAESVHIKVCLVVLDGFPVDGDKGRVDTCLAMNTIENAGQRKTYQRWQ